MHILYIHQFFATPLGHTGTRSYEFARRWAAMGHKVTMLTSTAQLTSEDMAQASSWFFKRFTVEGIDVLALTIPYRQQMGMFKRCLSFIAFLLLASIIALSLRGVDVVYVTSPPLTVGVPALVAKWLKQRKLIFEARDLWPKAPIVMGGLKNKLLIKILSWLEKIIYKNSAAIITVSDGMAEEIRQVAPAQKPIYVVPNGADLDVFRPDIDGGIVRQERGWGDKFILVHAGAMGPINGLDFVIDVAEKLRDYQDILFVLIGEGFRKSVLENRVKELGLINVEILSSVPKEQLPPILAAADVVMAIIGKFPIIERHASLNKFYDGLGAGKPVLLNYSGWQKQLIEDSNAGFGCKLYDIREFVEKVLYLYSHRSQLREIGQNARLIAVEKFDRDILSQCVLKVILSTKA